MNKLGSKSLTFIATMAALGNVLSLVSTQLTPIAPNIPLGPVSVSLALDISHLTTFIAALFGGPIVGSVTGAVGGLVAAFEFGFSKGNLVTGIGLPLGKAMTGLTAGWLFQRYQIDSTVKAAALTVTAYIPEAILTLILFRYLLPAAMGLPIGIATAIGLQIIVKACVEMVILGVLLVKITSNKGFKGYAESYFR
jgi:LytS/YehU family sensor histidine kinase